MGERRVESPLTHNHPTALDGRPQDPVVQQLLQLGDELPPAAPIGGWLQALGGHRHQGRVSQLQRHCQGRAAASQRAGPEAGQSPPWSLPSPGKPKRLMGISSCPPLRTSLSSYQLAKGYFPWPRQPLGPGRLSGRPAPALTWLLLHIEQGDVIIQVGHGALSRAAPSPLSSSKHVPGEMQGAPAATLLVAAVETVGGGGESWVSREGGEGPGYM